jgi:hypothetical protein
MANLSVELVRLFALGHLSGNQVQRVASSAWADGWGHGNTLARKLAKPGSTTSNNMARDVMRAAKEAGIGSTMAQPYVIDLPRGKGKLGILLPHEVYSEMVTKAGGSIAEFVVSEAERDSLMGKLVRTWCAHPDVQLEGEEVVAQVALFGIHADAVSWSTNIRAGIDRKVIVCSWNVVTGAGESVRLKRQPCFVLRSGRLCGCGCGGFCTYQVIFEVISWSFECLRNGLSPTCRHDSSPWTAHDLKVRMAGSQHLPHAGLAQVRGDWEWMAGVFRTRWYTAEYFCWMCGATRAAGPECFADFKPDAGHRGTLMSHEQYLMACAAEGAQPCNLFRCPGMRLEYLVVDSMHAGDLGCFADAIGGLFWCEVTCKRWHANQQIGLASLNASLQNFYTANRSLGLSVLHPVTMSQIKGDKDKFPSLKAKAAQVRHLAEYAVLLAYQHRDGFEGRPAYGFRGARLAGSEPEHLNHLVNMCEGMARYHRACAADVFDEDLCRSSMYSFLQGLAGLHVLWRRGLDEAYHGKMPWPLRPKSHTLQHLVEDKITIWGSPARLWCYKDEDFIGTVKTICAKSSHPCSLEGRVLEKLVIISDLSSRA